MRNWLDLSEDERKDLENNLMAALNSIGIKERVTPDGVALGTFHTGDSQLKPHGVPMTHK